MDRRHKKAAGPPGDRRRHVSALRRAWLEDRLEVPVSSENLPDELVDAVFQSAVCGRLGIPETLWQVIEQDGAEG